MSAPHYLNYIAGEWVDSDEKLDVINPATEQLAGTIALAGEHEVQRAVTAARAFADQGTLYDMRPAERAQLIYRIANKIRAIAERGVPLLVAENGKTTAEAQAEFNNAARYFEYYAGMADKIEGRSIPLGEGYVDFTYYEPLGVSGQIVPWNFPVDLAGRSMAPALAAGNAVVVKSPELTPLAMTLLAEACDNAGLPKGALSLLCGYGDVAGAALVANPGVDQIVFTGSVATGKTILHAAAERAIPCVMELGGKSAAVVFPDADLDQLMNSVDWGIFFNSGQVCSAMSRMLVHEDIHDEVLARVTELAAGQVLGEGSDESTTLTPVASANQRDQVLAMCATAEQQGAHLVTGGRSAERPGYFVEPTVFDRVLPHMNLFTDEVFGPVLAMSTFKTEAEAWQLANATDYGLVAGIFTNDLNIAMRGSKALKAGQIFVNEWYAGGVETPFGGVKLSGFGREKGQEALYSYVNTKNVAIRLLD
ncbi:MAG: aldehyde dehydrogenase family protein [Gammaproteobacteria bacterium]|nr:aldehyde dehydrogenase family protein [Gammaproteobacteria bacterium]